MEKLSGSYEVQQMGTVYHWDQCVDHFHTMCLCEGLLKGQTGLAKAVTICERDENIGQIA